MAKAPVEYHSALCTAQDIRVAELAFLKQYDLAAGLLGAVLTM